MKKAVRFLQACLLLLLISACSDDKEAPEPEPEPQVAEDCLVTATRHDAWNGRHTRYVYDEQKRLIAITNVLDEGYNEYYKFIYDSNGRISSQEKSFKEGGPPEYIGFYFYDFEGKVIRYDYYTRRTEPEYLLERAVFTYNSENLLVKEHREFPQYAHPLIVRRNLHYANGQLVRVERVDGLGTVTVEEHLTYTKDLIPLRGGAAYDKITTAIGYPTKYLVASHTVKDNVQGKVMEQISFNGHTTIMAGGKVSTYVRKYKDGRTETDTYTYTCN